jgi:Ala-tRNA(Pro) deacylase
MAIASKLKSFLDDNHVPYATIPHAPAFTAQEIAAKAHVTGDVLAKTVVVKADGHDLMAVLPASRRLDMDRLHDSLPENADVRLATEDELRESFPDCELGAMPPFGNLYGMPVLCDFSVYAHNRVAFNAGTHSELIEMRVADLVRLVHPDFGVFTQHV